MSFGDMENDFYFPKHGMDKTHLLKLHPDHDTTINNGGAA